MSAWPGSDDDAPPLTPSRLNREARALLENSFGLVRVEGELTNLSRPASGHLYFALKDAGAQVRCALFRQRAQSLTFRPVDGALVVARGRVTMYEPRGDFQMIVDGLEEAGEGTLKRAFEALKARLAAEGLFALERKRPLPRFVRRLALITAPKGAAVRDVLSTLAARWPLLAVDVLPAPMQGADAPPLIAAMLTRAATSGRYDAIVIARGGGSFEDLAAFNDEALARAIVASPVPVVSAIGHEVDFTIADFVADARAATPTAAATLLVPDRDEVAGRIAQARDALERAEARQLGTLAQRLDTAAAKLNAAHPSVRLERARLKLSALVPRLGRAFDARIAPRRLGLTRAAAALDRRVLAGRVARARARIVELDARARHALSARLAAAHDALDARGRTLNAVGPLATLGRGFVIVRDRASGAPLARAATIAPGQPLLLQFDDATLAATVDQRP